MTAGPAQNPFRPEGGLFSGQVMHLRLPGGDGPQKRHQFRYSLFRLMLDLDRLEEVTAGLRFLSVRRWNLLSFHPRDHGPRNGTNLRGWVDMQLRRAGRGPAERVYLYCFPRVLGYVFNPLAAYFCCDAAGRLVAVVYEVRNTNGDLFPYTFLLDGEDGSVFRHETRKSFYVSPFISPEQRYGFTLGIGEGALSLRIRVDGRQGLTLVATENMRGEALTDRAILRACLRMPFMTAKVMLGIYFEAVRLRRKGATMFPYPGPAGRFGLPRRYPGGLNPAERAPEPGKTLNEEPREARP